MISDGSTFVFLKLNRRSNALVGGLNAKTYAFGRPGFGLAVSCARSLTRGGTLSGQFFDEGEHFLGVLLPNYLKKRGLSGNVGQPTKIPDLVGHRRQR